MGKSGEFWQKFSCKAALPEETIIEETNFTWEQSDEAVMITLKVGQKLKRKNVKVEFSKYTASVFIANEGKWNFQLFDGILPKESRFKLSHTKLVLILRKVYYCYTWLGLESGGTRPFWSPGQHELETKEIVNEQPVGHSVTSSGEQRRIEKQVKYQKVSVNTKQRRIKKKKEKGAITESEAQYETRVKFPCYDDDDSILGAMVRGFHDYPTEVADCAAIKFIPSDVNNQTSHDNSPVQGLDTDSDKIEFSNLKKDKLPSFYDLFVCKPPKSYRS